MGRWFYGIYSFIASNRLKSLGVILLLITAVAFLAMRIEFEEDITKLIPQTKKSAQVQKVLKQVNFADKIIVNISRGETGSVEDLTNYASTFLDSIMNTSEAYIKQVQGYVQDEEINNTIDFVYDNLPLFLEEEDYHVIEQKLHSDSIQNITQNNYKTLVSPSGFVAKETILKDPLGITFMALNKLKGLGFGDDFTIENQFLLSKDKNHILLFITPTFPSSETDANADFASALYRLQDQLNSKFESKASCEYFGGALIAVANANQIKTDIQLTVGIAVTVLLLILVLFYKKLVIPLILFLPTVLGALVAIALLYLLRGRISAISLGIGSILLGVTLDYALHILTHIRSGHTIKQLYADIAKPILMSSLTTALAFLCLLFIKSQALQDLGVFAATSVLFSSVLALILIPQLYKSKVVSKQRATVIDRLGNFSFHKKKWLIGSIVILVVISCFTYNRVVFNNDLNTLNYQPEHLINAQNKLDQLINMSSKSVYLSTYADTQQEALEQNDSIFKMLESLQNEGKIIQFSSIGSLIASATLQNEKIKTWNAFWSEAKIEKVKNDLIQSGSALGFKPVAFSMFYQTLKTDFKPLKVEDYQAIKTISSGDYISGTEDFATVTTLVKVQDENLKLLVDSFENQHNTVVIDRKNMNETFLGNLKNDFNRLVLYSSVVVLVLLLLYYRSLSLTVVTALPIALTWLLTVGIMGLFGLKFNIFNIIICTFIFGLGIDYCIFITNGLLTEYRTGERELPIRKISIILSVITTLLGIGVLILAKHPALFTISAVSVVGILSASAMAFTIQPLLFKLFIGTKTRRPISIREFVHSLISFGYYGIGGLILSILSVSLIPIIPISKKLKMKAFHRVLSKFMKSVLYTNPFVSKTVLNPFQEDFKKQAIIIANHTSFLDILAMGMLHPKIIFLVNDWVYNSPIFGRAVRLAGFYPVSSGIESGVEHLQKKVNQGYSLMAFPEGTRSTTNKIKRFHKGAFYLAEQFNLDILPVLIHGNSEVLPKGTFVIKDGSITLKILKRIPFNDETFGKTYREKAKAISTFFRDEHAKLREEIEGETYFHNLVLEDFEYRGKAIYDSLKTDLGENTKVYKTLIDDLPENGIFVNISKDISPLFFLLALDSPDRKIFSFIENEAHRELMKNCVLTNTSYKVYLKDSLNDLDFENADVFVIDKKHIEESLLENLVGSGKLFVLLNESVKLYTKFMTSLGCEQVMVKSNMAVLKS
ncbi:MMPL family transporter [Hyunsoonleella sp. SJ7]|uniref:MMPL family transporter n=1 Tax=Hyunsoonleella aquatilis TaxID=2762758 RepID=A0A923HBY2_9FLAO|nr:MMPL family transporter [Hyunsoonleella aquatilis]MBC3757213.1 MMPL family transporter [Hyunsoonleella aquatilis]